MTKFAKRFDGSSLLLGVVASVFLVACDARKAAGPPAAGGASGAAAGGSAGGTAGAPVMGSAGGVGGSAQASGTLTVLAGGPGPSASLDGVGQNARFSDLSVIAFDGVGSVYAADGLAIRRVALATGEVTTLIQDAAQALAPDGRGNVYYTKPPYSHVVKKLDVASGTATVLAGSASCGEACTTTDGVGTQASFNWPAGLVLDGAGKMFVAEANGQVIRQIDLVSGSVTTLAGTPGKVGHADGVAAAAQFWQPWGIVSDSTGDVYVNEAGNQTLRKIVPGTTEVTTLTASGFVAAGAGVDVIKFNGLNGLTIDGAGNLYIAVGDLVRKLVPATGEMTTVVGALGHTGVVPGPLPASLSRPMGLAALPGGRLLIASDNRILVATF